MRHILAGTNQATEGMRMPADWNWHKRDVRNIRALGKKFGKTKIKTFPTFSTIDFIMHRFVFGIRWHSFLDYLPFNKEKAIRRLEEDFCYKRYPYKHYESIFTRFYQGYILPSKFGVDKRLLHLSTLVAAGQMQREDALALMREIPYPSREELDSDREYFLKKMEWTSSDLAAYLEREEKRHDCYSNEAQMYTRLRDMLPPEVKGAVKRKFGV